MRVLLKQLKFLRVKNDVVENNTVDNTEDKPRQERQRRTPRHLRASNNQRRRRNEVKSPMPLFAAVASPELASGKVCIRLFCGECTERN